MKMAIIGLEHLPTEVLESIVINLPPDAILNLSKSNENAVNLPLLLVSRLETILSPGKLFADKWIAK